MVAVSRFVEFSVTSQTYATGASTDATCKGTRGYSRGTSLSPPGAGNDSFTITKDSNDDLTVAINGVSPGQISLASGTDLDPRFVARDIAFKLHAKSSDNAFKYAQCEWRNGGGGPNAENSFIIYSGLMGSNASANVVNVTAGTYDAQATLGFTTKTEAAGTDDAGAYSGAITLSGAYGGQFDDYYTIMISDGELVADPTQSRPAGPAATSDGVFTGGSDNLYTIVIDTSNGYTAGGGSGSVPQFSVTDVPLADHAGPTEILYWDHWYDIGDLGVRVKWADGVFENGDEYYVQAYTASGTGYPAAVGAAKYIWTSTRGDSSKAHSIPAKTTTAATGGEQVGTRGVTIAFGNTDTLSLGETYGITCIGPQPIDSDTTLLNFGNVTVSTASAVKVVWFELISGAVSMSTVKFSLQSDGTFTHHDQGSDDTEFHFGTSGAGNPAAGAGAGTNSQYEFSVNSTTGLGDITTADIDSDTPTVKVYASKANLGVVASADLSETLGNYQGGTVSDFVFLAILLGANETGANSTINYRMYFDFS